MGRKSSIATRWFVNSFVVVAIILALMAVGLFFLLRQYYYGAVGQLLQSEASIISGILNRHYQSFGIVEPNEIRRSIEAFDKKNRMELMAISHEGEIVMTSSGFSPYEAHDMPDYFEALESPGGTGQYIGVFKSRHSGSRSGLQLSEKYMAVTVMLPSVDESVYSAIRLVASLDEVDSQIYTFTLFAGILGIGTLLLLLLLGLYFIRSIVYPLRQIGNTAKRLADGDFSVRITGTKNEDEIGELCKVINHMADELENSESLKNEFISSVSHELRTPLTAIKGWSETVLEQTVMGLQEDRMTEKGMNVIIAETDRLTVMVEELLDFSRIQTGNLSLHMADIDILEELSSAVEVYAERANREGITIVSDYEKPINADNGDENKLQPHLYVRADKHRIRQVFINIIDNAVKYSKKGSTVTVGAVAGSGDVAITVSDNGCGISKSDLPNVKMKFFKANNTRRGAGIGLAVVDEIVALHSGKLDIESELNKGTKVKITFPLVQIEKFE
ncbi:MAG: HAMP domain-containing histidine kinase [Oscillospiraceae bacterium]|nr:HAMP domain-containing histidine kinase [Oscillospiraceae bacterium]